MLLQCPCIYDPIEDDSASPQALTSTLHSPYGSSKRPLLCSKDLPRTGRCFQPSDPSPFTCTITQVAAWVALATQRRIWVLALYESGVSHFSPWAEQLGAHHTFLLTMAYSHPPIGITLPSSLGNIITSCTCLQQFHLHLSRCLVKHLACAGVIWDQATCAWSCQFLMLVFSLQLGP